MFSEIKKYPEKFPGGWLPEPNDHLEIRVIRHERCAVNIFYFVFFFLLVRGSLSLTPSGNVSIKNIQLSGHAQGTTWHVTLMSTVHHLFINLTQKLLYLVTIYSLMYLSDKKMVKETLN